MFVPLHIFIWLVYLRYLSFVFASLALECVVTQIGNGYQATEIAYVDSIKET